MCSRESAIPYMSRSRAKTSKSWRINVIAFRIAVTVVSIHHGTLKPKKLFSIVLRHRILGHPPLGFPRVDMNMITQLHLDLR